MERGMLIQYIIVGIVFVALVVYVVCKFINMRKHKGSCCSCCDKESCAIAKSAQNRKCDNCS